MTAIEIRNFFRPEDGQRSTIGVEREFWEALENIATERGTTWSDLVTELCNTKSEGCNRARILRLFVLDDFKTKLRKLSKSR